MNDVRPNFILILCDNFRHIHEFNLFSITQIYIHFDHFKFLFFIYPKIHIFFYLYVSFTKPKKKKRKQQLKWAARPSRMTSNIVNYQNRLIVYNVYVYLTYLFNLSSHIHRETSNVFCMSTRKRKANKKSQCLQRLITVNGVFEFRGTLGVKRSLQKISNQIESFLCLINWPI